jgi:hypothetical protein
MFAERRGTPFIDLQVYDDSLLKSIQDMPSICAYTIASPAANNGYLKRYLNKTIIHSAKAADSFSNLLASVQALILVLVMRLFSRNVESSPSVDALLDILGKLTFQLWQKAPARISASLTPRQA